MAKNTSSWEFQVKTSHPGIWQECLETPTLKANQELYQRWHKDYDADLFSHGYTAPAQAASDLEAAITSRRRLAIAASLYPSGVAMSAEGGQKAADWSIIDVGAGTGLVGQELAKRGFTSIDALDSSPEMLVQADAKRVYRRCIVADANDATAVAKRTYDAAISVGTFTYGHLGAAGLDSVVSYLREGGLFVVTSRVDYFDDPQAGFGARVGALEASGVLTKVRVSPELSYTNDGGASYRCWVFSVHHADAKTVAPNFTTGYDQIFGG